MSKLAHCGSIAMHCPPDRKLPWAHKAHDPSLLNLLQLDGESDWLHSPFNNEKPGKQLVQTPLAVL